jgi:hypothetical protein
MTYVITKPCVGTRDGLEAAERMLADHLETRDAA